MAGNKEQIFIFANNRFEKALSEELVVKVMNFALSTSQLAKTLRE